MSIQQPNIILITTDQQRFDTVGAHAPSFMRTPHLDNLAREGITFSNAYSDCPLCVPARTTIMTGLHAFTHGLTCNMSDSMPIVPDRSLPGRMKKQGYQTLAVGKMHFTPARARYGFDEMFLLDDYYEEMSKIPGIGRPMHHGMGQNELYPAMATVPESYTLTAWTVDKCADFIQRRRDPQQPFFLWCSFSKPHPPLDPPEPYYSMYRNCPIPEPWIGDWSQGEQCPEAFRRFRESWSLDLIPQEIIREARSAYYGLITQIDYNMGRLMGALQDSGLAKDTMILFTSDHGELLGDHCSGAKSYFYEGASHVPMILRLPKSWKNRPVGKFIEQPVCLADILATCVSAGGGSAEDTDGQDLIALAEGRLEHPREWIEGAFGNTTIQWYGITNGYWKYIYYFGDSKEQLFHLQDDPRELVNLSLNPQYTAKLLECRQLLIDRLEIRGSSLVEDGKLAVFPLPEEAETERRAKSLPGYRTSTFPLDVRH